MFIQDSLTHLHRRLPGTATTTRGDSGTRPVSLPSAYIPSSQRVGATAKTAPLNATVPTPTINVLGSTNDDLEKSMAGEIECALSLLSSSVSAIHSNLFIRLIDLCSLEAGKAAFTAVDVRTTFAARSHRSKRSIASFQCQNDQQ